MLRYVAVLLAGVTAFAADDPWTKVKKLKSGTEIRIVKKGASAPLTGKLDEARDESLTMVLKNEQVTVEKDSIERLDYRPSKPGGRIVAESKSKTDAPDPTPPKGMAHGANVPGASSST